MELKLKKPFPWFLCQLHTNELPLRHLLQIFDGKTSGPKGFRGDIGKILNRCEKFDVIFNSIPLDLPDMCQLDLSTNHKSISEEQ